MFVCITVIGYTWLCLAAWHCEAMPSGVWWWTMAKLEKNVVENLREIAPGFKLALSGSFQASLDLFFYQERGLEGQGKMLQTFYGCSLQIFVIS